MGTSRANLDKTVAFLKSQEFYRKPHLSGRKVSYKKPPAAQMAISRERAPVVNARLKRLVDKLKAVIITHPWKRLIDEDSRGDQLLTQRMRFFKRQMQCRGDIDRLNAPFLAIYQSLIPPEEEKAKQKQLMTLLENIVIREWPKGHLLGEDLGPLNVKEIQDLEKQLERTLAQASQRKTQIMIDQIEELRKKERQLGDINNQLKIKLQAQGQVQNFKGFQSLGSSSSGGGNGHENFGLDLFQTNPLDCHSNPGSVLQIGYHDYVRGEGSSIPRSMACETNIVQGWLL